MQPHGGLGSFSFDLAHLLGGAVLVLSFVLLYQRRVAAVVNTYAAQALVLAAAAAWQGWVQSAPELYLTALIALVAKGVIIPVALHRIIRRLHIHRNIETALRVFPSMAIGVLLVALAIMAVMPTTLNGETLTREDLATALSVVLLGLLTMITRRSAPTQVIGFLSLENGLILAAVGVTGMPMVLELSTAFLVLVAFTVFGLFFFRLRDRLGSLDTRRLDLMTEEHP